MYEMYIDGVLFPVTPSNLSVKINNMNKTVTLINEGEVNLIKTPGLSDITVNELLLPVMQRYPFARYESGRFYPASHYLEKLESWKNKKKPVQFKLLRTEPEGSGGIRRTSKQPEGTEGIRKTSKLSWDTDIDVTIEDYEIMEDAEKYGMDVCIKLVMKQYRYWGTKKLKKKKNGSYRILKCERKTKEKAKKYTVKKGDTLLKIARKELNDGSQRKSIYTLNKKAIEKAAREHGRKSSSNGYYLYKGTVLKLPGTVTAKAVHL